MTNGDRIRQMSNKELVEVFINNCDWCVHKGDENCEVTCLAGIKAYLDKEVQE